jgi:endonuclease III
MARKSKRAGAASAPSGADVLRVLLEQYPAPKLALNWHNPLELLIAVILSAQCTDARVNAVTAELFRKYRSARDYAQADVGTFEQEIRPTGFYRNKAKLVMACCKKLVADHGGKVPDTLEALTALPGVGRKTANMVLGNAFGKPGIAVDTHVMRVSVRLGLVQGGDAETIEAALMSQLPRAQWTAFTNAVILHGRRVCTARAPHCADCALNALCAWPDKRV